MRESDLIRVKCLVNSFTEIEQKYIESINDRKTIVCLVFDYFQEMKYAYMTCSDYANGTISLYKYGTFPIEAFNDLKSSSFEAYFNEHNKLNITLDNCISMFIYMYHNDCLDKVGWTKLEN